MTKFGLGYTCCFCNKLIPDNKIPDQVKERIGMSLVWHESCKVMQIEK